MDKVRKTITAPKLFDIGVCVWGGGGGVGRQSKECL